MKAENSLGKVQLLFSAAALDNGILNHLMASPVLAAPSAADMEGFDSPNSLHVDPLGTIPPILGKISKLPDNILGIDFDRLLKVFKGLKVDQIELWINGAAETEGLLKLALSAKGEGGIKIILKPEA